MKKSLIQLAWKKNFVSDLPGDPIFESFSRKVFKVCYSLVACKLQKEIQAIAFSSRVAKFIELERDWIDGPELLELQQYLINELKIPPWATCYGGYQFGYWADQLGDGRVCYFGEIKTSDNKIIDFQLKGSGKTPYSRSFDGKATLQSSLREFIGAEALQSLGIPTTKILGVMLTGERVMRTPNNFSEPILQKGAISIRISESFTRFGHFELPFYNRDFQVLDELVEYIANRNFPESKSENKAKAIFQNTVKLTAILVAKWQSNGFVHGVMNTDNMSIIGETIDYGPYGFLEEFNQNWTPNTTDSATQRYTYQNQPRICMWNLGKLAVALAPLIEDEQWISEQLTYFWTEFWEQYYTNFKDKLGLKSPVTARIQELIDFLIKLLAKSKIDFTIFFRELSNFEQIHSENEGTFFSLVQKSFYDYESVLKNSIDWNRFIKDYWDLIKSEAPIGVADRKNQMDRLNPRYIPRNWILKNVVECAENGNLEPFERLYEMVLNPFKKDEKFEIYYQRQPGWSVDNRDGCQLSCSS